MYLTSGAGLGECAHASAPSAAKSRAIPADRFDLRAL
jgi:hypothetical protein